MLAFCSSVEFPFFFFSLFPNVGHKILEAVPGGVKKQSIRTFIWSTVVGGDSGAHRDIWEAATTMRQTGACKGVWEVCCCGCRSGHPDHKEWAPGIYWEATISDEHNLPKVMAPPFLGLSLSNFNLGSCKERDYGSVVWAFPEQGRVDFRHTGRSDAKLTGMQIKCKHPNTRNTCSQLLP